MLFINEDIYKCKSGIYAIENTVTHYVYVGQTKMRFIKRYWHHCWKLKNGSHDNCFLQRAYNVYGDSAFLFRVLAVVEQDQDIDNMERKFIAFYRNINLCYNIQSGGQDSHCSRPLSSEAKKKIGEKNRQHMLGRKASAETKKKMSNKRKGSQNCFAKLNEQDVIEIRNLIIEGVSDRAISKQYNVTPNNISHIRKGDTWSHVTGFKPQ